VMKTTLRAAGCRRPRSGGSRTGDGPRGGGACASNRIEATGILPRSSSEPGQGPPGSASARDEPPRGGLLTSGPPLYYLRALTGPKLAVARRLVALGFLVPAER
jgi:hypothetical protein